MEQATNNGQRPAQAPAEVSTTLRVAAWFVPIAIAVQAALAGPASYGAPKLFVAHGWIGSATFLAAGLTLLLAFTGRQPGGVLLLALLVTAGGFAQIGLGYLAHRAGLAAAGAVHIPLGVLLLGLSLTVALLLTVRAPRR
ncbi:MAG: hypothetical protein WD011_02050 [Nitriliruptoraceae bacterium]